MSGIQKDDSCLSESQEIFLTCLGFLALLGAGFGMLYAAHWNTSTTLGQFSAIVFVFASMLFAKILAHAVSGKGEETGENNYFRNIGLGIV